jgi:hypothetical protein
MNSQDARKALAREIRNALVNDEQRTPDNIEERDRIVREWRAQCRAPLDDFLDQAYHSLLHFLTDRDIRIKDIDYAIQQHQRMRELAERLER